jgi:hypothetical protein
MEPLSIVTGVAGLLTAAVKICTTLKRLIDDIKIASTKIQSFFADVEGFAPSPAFDEGHARAREDPIVYTDNQSCR